MTKTYNYLGITLLVALFSVASVLGVTSTAPSASADERPSLRTLLDACNTGAGISGAATVSDGTPLADAPVNLFAEREGAGEVTLPVLARSRTNATGCYELDLIANRKLLDAADRYGIVNLHLTVQEDDQLHAVNIARDLAVGAGGRMRLLETGTQAGTKPYRPRRAVLGRPVAGPVHQSFGPQADTVRADAARSTGTLRLGGHTGVDASAAADLERTVGMTPDRVTLPDSITAEVRAMHVKRVKVFKKHPVLVGQWFSKIRGVRQEWRYTQGASSSLASAHSSVGGSYEKSKTYSESTSATVTFPVSKGVAGKYYRTYFRYAKYMYIYCDTVGCAPTGYRVKPYKWERGTQVISGIPQIRIKGENCSRYYKGSKDWSRGSKAVTWTDGVLIKGDLLSEIGPNISLSAQTGFTSDAENYVHFTQHGKLCGWAGPLSSSPRILAARPR